MPPHRPVLLIKPSSSLRTVASSKGASTGAWMRVIRQCFGKRVVAFFCYRAVLSNCETDAEDLRFVHTQRRVEMKLVE